MKKSNLDEMQEQNLLKIEHNGCWLAFWGLLVALIIEGILGFDGKAVAGEWIVFMVLSVYIAADCLRKGIWDRQVKPGMKSNLISSLIGGIVAGVFIALRNYRIYPDYPVGSVFSGIFVGVTTFFLIFAVLGVCMFLYKKRRKKLESE